MSKLFYNTTGYSGDRLKAAKEKVASQEEVILGIFELNKDILLVYRPAEMAVECELLGKDWPITSIRRAMYNLTRKGLLVKTDKQVEGPCGHKEYLWKLKGE